MAASKWDQNSSCADAAVSAFTFTIFQEFETKSGPQAKAFPPVLQSYICGSVCNAAEDLFGQIQLKMSLVSFS